MIRPTSLPCLILAALIIASAALRSTPVEAFTPAEAKAPMTVTLVRSDAADCGTDCPEWLALTGAIGPGTAALFAAALARLGPRRLPVLVDSPGGAVEAAIAMGNAIRARKLDVAVAGTALTDCAAADKACAARRRQGIRPGFIAGGIAACASSCVLMLAAGMERSVAQNSYVGVHQMVIHKTLTRVINTFRIMRRMVGGHPVEVSRTLIATRPISSRAIDSAAPEQLYSEVDRYLLKMGVAESIMPLMRSAPPSGIHWMTPAELAATRIATDTTEARTLVARATEPKAAASPSTPTVPTLAAMTRDDGPRWLGTVAWRVDRATAASPSGLALVGDVDIPDHLHGRVSIMRSTDPNAVIGFTLVSDFGPASALDAVSTLMPPKFCDAKICNLPVRAGPWEARGGPHAFEVIRPWGDGFLSALRDRDWMSFGARLVDGSRDDITLALSGPGAEAIAEWERLCCGLAASLHPRTERPSLPAVAGQPSDSVAIASPQQPSEARVTYRLQRGADGASAVEGVATMTWTPITALDPPGAPGSTALLGAVEIPEAGLQLSLQVGPALSGTAGDVVLDMSFVEHLERFGPVLSLSIPPVWGSDSHVALLTDQVYGSYYGGRAILSSALDMPESAVLNLALTDREGRRLSMMMPIDGPLGALLRAARKARTAS